MIKFRTEVDLTPFKKKLSYRHQSLMIGSCFAENIGFYMQERCLPIQINPFGILYNPFSIANCLEMVMARKKFLHDDLFSSNGLYHSFSHHSRFSGPDPIRVLEQININIAEAYRKLSSASHLFLTFGTSWVFHNTEGGNVVSNCHKLPPSTFTHKRLSVEQITTRWISIIDHLKRINPELHLVFTVSPIRHLKDGAHENQLSKSTLLLAIDELISIYGSELISYFPSYEIVMDDLRDYRFYAADMTHLSELTIDYIREKFMMNTMDEEGRTIANEVGKLLHSLNHKPFNPQEKAYNSFLKTQIEKLELLQNRYPFVDFQTIRRKFHEKIID